jgi:two-component system phosphate regulon sensor histidine kinase PhoR
MKTVDVTKLRGRLPDPANIWRPALLILLLILLPSVMIGAVGILVLVFQRATVDVVLGVLILAFCAALGAGIVLTLSSIRRRARLSALQTAFVSKVSHDLRTPLTSIRMFVETLQMGRIHDTERYNECLGVLAAETARLSSMIDRLLDWARMEAGRKQYQFTTTSVSDVVDQAIAAFRPQTLSGAVKLAVEVEPDLPAIQADGEALSEVLLDLLNNAYKYTGEEKQITVRARRDGRSVVLSVTDNGPGIPRSEHVRIFERFYRGSEPSTREIEGSGLGLAMARHTIDAHHGTIHLESEVGRGSTFSLVLPVT